MSAQVGLVGGEVHVSWPEWPGLRVQWPIGREANWETDVHNSGIPVPSTPGDQSAATWANRASRGLRGALQGWSASRDPHRAATRWFNATTRMAFTTSTLRELACGSPVEFAAMVLEILRDAEPRRTALDRHLDEVSLDQAEAEFWARAAMGPQLPPDAEPVRSLRSLLAAKGGSYGINVLEDEASADIRAAAARIAPAMRTLYGQFATASGVDLDDLGARYFDLPRTWEETDLTYRRRLLRNMDANTGTLRDLVAEQLLDDDSEEVPRPGEEPVPGPDDWDAGEGA